MEIHFELLSGFVTPRSGVMSVRRNGEKE